MTEVLLIYLIPRGRQNPHRQDALRRRRPAHRLRGERDRLLSEVPDGRKTIGG